MGIEGRTVLAYERLHRTSSCVQRKVAFGELHKRRMAVHQGIYLAILATVLVFEKAAAGEVSLLVKDAKTPLTHLYLDFDKTITIDDFSTEVRKMFCKGGKYPKCDCSWLPHGRCDGDDYVSVHGMAAQLARLPAGGRDALTHSLGGAERLEKVRSWLQRMRHLMNGNVFIMSTSWYPVTGKQWQAYLFQVSELLDLGFKKDHILTLADPGPGLGADKGKAIRKHMRMHNAHAASTMFADDSGGNIKSAKGVCNTLYINKRQGMDDTDLQYIEALAGGLTFFNIGC